MKLLKTIEILSAGICLATLAAPSYADYCEPTTSSSRSPYNNTSGNTRTALSIAKHQYQGDDGKYDCVSNSEMLDGKYAKKTVGGSDYFYFYDEPGVGDTLYFKVDESIVSRTELRLDSYRADSVSPQPRFAGSFLVRGSNSARSKDFTVAQLHVDTSTRLTTDSSVLTSSPMLRIAYIDSRDGIDNHFWAVFRPDPSQNSSTGSNSFEFVPLGEALTGVSNENSFIMKYGTNSGNKMLVTVNGVSTSFDITQWTQDDIYIYNKAGCYTDGDVGDCQIQYTELSKSNF